MMKELTFKAKNISGKTLKPGTLIYKVEENKFLSWLTKIGLRTIRVKEVEAAHTDDLKKELFIAKDKNEATKGYSIVEVDTSDFNAGEALYLSDTQPGTFDCSKGVVVGKVIKPGIYQVKLS